MLCCACMAVRGVMGAASRGKAVPSVPVYMELWEWLFPSLGFSKEAGEEQQSGSSLVSLLYLSPGALIPSLIESPRVLPSFSPVKCRCSRAVTPLIAFLIGLEVFGQIMLFILH